MHDPTAAGRRAAMRAVSIQALVAALVAAGFLLQGPRPALAAAVAGAAMVAGNGVAALTALGGGIQPARAAFSRLLLGVLGKWAVVLAVFAVALEAWRLPPLPMLVGLVAGMLAYLVALNKSVFRAAGTGRGTTRQKG